MSSVTEVGKRRKVEEEEEEKFRVSYLKLRSRMLLVTIPEKKNTTNLIPAPWVSPSTVLEKSTVDDVSYSDGEEDGDCSSYSSNGSGGEIEGDEVSSRSGGFEKVDVDSDAVTRCRIHWKSKEERGRELKHEGERRSLELQTLEYTGMNSAPFVMPPQVEIEEFFFTMGSTEVKQIERFAEKYNFDVENDVPLNGRYDWVPVVKR